MVYGVINRVMWSMKNRIKSVVMCVVVGSSPSRPEVVIMINKYDDGGDDGDINDDI